MKPWEYRKIDVKERVFSRVIIDDITECHNFTGSKNQDGYGQVKHNGKTIRVHKWVWEYTNGYVPEGLCVLHSCDNPSCLNINHLRLGTHKENMRDKVERGHSKEMARGVMHPRAMAKLNPFKVARIKALVGMGMTQTSVAKRFGVHLATVNDLILGKTWPHVGAAP